MLATTVRATQMSSGVTVLTSPVSVACGFPSPAQDYYDGPIDLTEHLIDDPASTFIVRASGHSMTGAGIFDGDELIVDRGRRAHDGDVVVAVLDGEMTVKRLTVSGRRVTLHAENAEHPDITVPELSDLQIWGVVTTAIHHLNRTKFR